MFLYKQVPAERLSGLNRFLLLGKPLLGLILINRIRASRGSCNYPDGLSPRKRKSAIAVNCQFLSFLHTFLVWCAIIFVIYYTERQSVCKMLIITRFLFVQTIFYL